MNLKNSKANFEETFESTYSSKLTANSENIIPKIVSKNDIKYAVIRINSFMPCGDYDIYNYIEARAKIHGEVNKLRDFILNNKNSIDGVIFDVRGNGGGYGSFPQLIANMFTNAFVKNMDASPLVSEANKNTFNNLFEF